MHPYRVILSTYRKSYGLSTRPDGPNTLTHQSASTRNAYRDPPHSPVTNLITRTGTATYIEAAYHHEGNAFNF